MLVIGNEELKEPLGITIQCEKCEGTHPIEYGDEVLKDGTPKPSKLLSFYKCGDKTYLAGINGLGI